MARKEAVVKSPRVQVMEVPARRQPQPADACAMVIFGAGGDLTKRLVIPALYNLSRTKMLPENFALIGADLAEGSDENWRDHLYDMLKSFVGNPAAEFTIDRIDKPAWQRLAAKMSYVQGDLTKPVPVPASKRLGNDDSAGTCRDVRGAGSGSTRCRQACSRR